MPTVVAARRGFDAAINSMIAFIRCSTVAIMTTQNVKQLHVMLVALSAGDASCQAARRKINSAQFGAVKYVLDGHSEMQRESPHAHPIICR